MWVHLSLQTLHNISKAPRGPVVQRLGALISDHNHMLDIALFPLQNVDTEAQRGWLLSRYKTRQ